MQTIQFRLACLLGISALAFPHGIVSAQDRTASTNGSRDSAGVRIYDYRSQRAIAPAFVIADAPFVQLKALPEDSTSAFGVTSISLLRGGVIAVGISQSITRAPGSIAGGANAAGGNPPNPATMPPARPAVTRIIQVRLFDSTGTYLTRFGEFGSTLGTLNTAPHSVAQLPNGNLLVSTLRPELALFNEAGMALRGARFGFGQNSALQAGFLDDFSSIIAVETKSVALPVTVGDVQLRRLPFVLERHDTLGTLIEQLPIARNYLFVPAGGGRVANTSIWPVTPTDLVAAAAKNIWRLDPLAWELTGLDMHGALKSITRPAIPERLKDAVLGASVPNVYPTAMLADEQGRLWMDSAVGAQPSTNADEHLWLVVDASGKQMGSVKIPVGLRPMLVRRGVIYGMYPGRFGAGSIVAGFRVRELPTPK